MTPDASAVVAQVDAALLIVLTVDARFQKNNSKKEKAEESDAINYDGASRKHAWLYLVALCGLSISLGVTLISVTYYKPLNGFAFQLILLCTFIGVFPITFSAIDRIVRQIDSKKTLVVVLIIVAALIIWYVCWAAIYIPGGFW